VLLLLLATAWVIIEPPRSLSAAAQFGLALAALIGTYPLWAPLPAALALAIILSDERRTTNDERRNLILWSFVICYSPRLMRLVSRFTLAFAPALALALLDVLPRMRIGQAVLAHEGLVTLPTPQRLMPIVLALPCALLVIGGRAGRAMAGMAALVALAIGALALAAHGGLAAVYHSYKLLFVLTPLAAAIVGAALTRLVADCSDQFSNREEHEEREGKLESRQRQEHKTGVGSWNPTAQEMLLEDARFRYQVNNEFFMTALHTEMGAINSGGYIFAHPLARPASATTSHSATNHTKIGNPPSRSSRSWRFIFELNGRWLAFITGVLALAIAGSFQIIPAPATQVITPDMVAAARWLRANAPKDAARAITVGMPAGPLSYWVEVGLLGQWRDKAAAARRDFTVAPPTRESWLIDRQLAPVAITTAANMPLPGESTLARFGDIAIVRRAAKIDTTPLNPLLIRYRSFWEDQRLKTAIELQRALPGPLPLLDLRLYHNGAPIADFALPPEQDRTRPQYLGADLLPATLGGEGYVNQSAYPVFAAPALAPTGALSLTLRLTLAGAAIEERQLASFERAADGQIARLAPSSGELIYLRRDPLTDDMRTVDLDFGGALRLTGWDAPARAAAGAPIAIGLRWQAPRALEHALFPELHILNAAGQPVATSISAPQDGFYPTWRWRPGETVAEQRRIQLPPSLAPGVYTIAVRVHDFAAGSVLKAQGNADGLARIGEIAVERKPDP
jgi:hypothetical protein